LLRILYKPATENLLAYGEIVRYFYILPSPRRLCSTLRLSDCLSASKFYQTYIFEQRSSVKLRKSSGSESGFGNFLKEPSTLQDMVFFHNLALAGVCSLRVLVVVVVVVVVVAAVVVVVVVVVVLLLLLLLLLSVMLSWRHCSYIVQLHSW